MSQARSARIAQPARFRPTRRRPVETRSGRLRDGTTAAAARRDVDAGQDVHADDYPPVAGGRDRRERLRVNAARDSGQRPGCRWLRRLVLEASAMGPPR
jgi:hypothetical protein